MNEVQVGRLVLISHGNYSSYNRIGWFVAVQAFNPDEQLKQYLVEHDGQKEDYAFEDERFLAWLIKKALIVEVEEFFDEWNLGDYMRADEVRFMPRAALSALGDKCGHKASP